MLAGTKVPSKQMYMEDSDSYMLYFNSAFHFAVLKEDQRTAVNSGEIEWVKGQPLRISLKLDASTHTYKSGDSQAVTYAIRLCGVVVLPFECAIGAEIRRQISPEMHFVVDAPPTKKRRLQ